MDHALQPAGQGNSGTATAPLLSNMTIFSQGLLVHVLSDVGETRIPGFNSHVVVESISVTSPLSTLESRVTL